MCLSPEALQLLSVPCQGQDSQALGGDQTRKPWVPLLGWGRIKDTTLEVSVVLLGIHFQFIHYAGSVFPTKRIFKFLFHCYSIQDTDEAREKEQSQNYTAALVHN